MGEPQRSVKRPIEFRSKIDLMDATPGCEECKNVSFINNLNFKNIDGLHGLNFECFSDEVHACIEESSLSALSKMIQAFVDIYGHSLPEGFMSWHDVYKYYILSSLSALEDNAITNCSSRTLECIQKKIK